MLALRTGGLRNTHQRRTSPVSATQKGAGAIVIDHNSNSVLTQEGLRSGKLSRLSLKSPKIKGGLAKNMNYLMQSLNLNIRKTRTKTFNTNSKAGTRIADPSVGKGREVVDFASVVLLDLLKWSVLFIAQSLSPLKRKHDYYSLLFFKILETRGFLDLNLITKPDSLREAMILDRSRALRPVEGGANANPAALTHSTETLPLQTTVISLHPSHSSLPKATVDGEKGEVSGQTGQSRQSGKFGQSGQSGSVKPKPLDIEAAKKATITFYSGGRFISD